MVETKTKQIKDGLVGFLPPHSLLKLLQTDSAPCILQDGGTTADLQGHYPKGKYLVILFVNQVDRPGAQRDLENLRVMYEGHKVLAYVDFIKDITFDLALADAQEECKLNNYETLVVYFGMHGGSTSLWDVSYLDLGRDAKGAFFSTERARKKFVDGLREFDEKSRIFINDQCRTDIPLTSYPEIAQISPPESPLDAPEHLVQVYSTQKGCLSYRHRDSGTWLIQKLSEVLVDPDFMDKCLTKIMEEVQKRVEGMAARTSGAALPQIPTCHSTLTKKLVHTTAQDLKDMEKEEEWA